MIIYFIICEDIYLNVFLIQVYISDLFKINNQILLIFIFKLNSFSI